MNAVISADAASGLANCGRLAACRDIGSHNLTCYHMVSEDGGRIWAGRPAKASTVPAAAKDIVCRGDTVKGPAPFSVGTIGAAVTAAARVLNNRRCGVNVMHEETSWKFDQN
jgi:hypothetical protein